jgi:hypothetical protein
LRLPEFWPDTPAAWFAHVESKFRLRNVTEEAEMYDHLVGSLPRSSVRLVLDLLERPDVNTPYTSLKRRLLASHELTDFQRIEKLFQLEPLGARKPSELLGEMLELCPRGQEDNMFFLFLFLQRLPREIRVLLDDENQLSARDMAVKADRLWAKHSHQHGSVAAVATEEENQVAAVQPPSFRSRGGRGRGGRFQRGKQARRGQATAAGAGVPPADAPASVARSSTGLCYYHWTYGDKAHSCESPCSWGN